MHARRHPVRIFSGLFLLCTLALGLPLHLGLQWPLWAAWLAPANAVAFALWGYDKAQARREGLRVPEVVLHGMALLGATPASLCAMPAFRHKTRKRYFLPLYVLFLCAQVATFLVLRERT